jgi:hypothetical protein
VYSRISRGLNLRCGGAALGNPWLCLFRRERGEYPKNLTESNKMNRTGGQKSILFILFILAKTRLGERIEQREARKSPKHDYGRNSTDCSGPIALVVSLVALGRQRSDDDGLNLLMQD